MLSFTEKFGLLMLKKLKMWFNFWWNVKGEILKNLYAAFVHMTVHNDHVCQVPKKVVCFHHRLKQYLKN